MCGLILCNANVITMDPVLPKAELVAVDGEHIASVAGNGMLSALKKPGSQIIDCMGRTVIPGFVDAHCHVLAYAESLVSLNLSPHANVYSISDLQRRISDFCKGQPPGAWVRGKAYDEFYGAEKRLPNRWELDAAAPIHPVKVTHRSGHAHILNSLALKYVAISEESGDPPEGFIDRDPESGVPTGILYGMGGYLARKIPPLNETEMERGVALANERLLSYGITSIHDASSFNGISQWERFEDLKARKIIQPRLAVMMGWEAFEKSQREMIPPGWGKAGFMYGAVKIITGQVTGSLHPTQKELHEHVSSINKAHLQAVIHAVEEPEIEAACNAIAYALDKHPRRDHRHRIEHCSVCPPALLRRIKELGITVVTQPSFIYYSGDRYLKTVPSGQLEHLYPICSIVRSGVPAAAGSDSPVSDPNPLVGICAAVARLTKSGQRVLPQQGVSIDDALRMHTLGAAVAGFEEGIKGSISPGKLADMVILSEDPLTVDPDRIKDIHVTMTILGGRIAYSK